MRRALHILALGALVSACGSNGPKSRTPAVVKPPPPIELPREALLRQLEASVLESYSQLTLGNLGAYRDGIALDRPITLVGVFASDVVYGRAPLGIRRDRRLYRELGPSILSKNLDVHLSQDGSVGWVFDEVSYRVPYMGRTASIPIRWTGVYVRDLDRWVQVLEHQSYAVPIGEIKRLALAGELAAPEPMNTHYHRLEGASSLILGILGRAHNAAPDYREKKFSGDPDALLLMPDPGGEFHGAEVPRTPPLASLFSEETTVGLRDYRIFIGPGTSVGWAAANLVVNTYVHDRPVELGLRATYLLENRPTWGWVVVKAHVSVPLTRSQLSDRVFGPEEVDSVIDED